MQLTFPGRRVSIGAITLVMGGVVLGELLGAGPVPSPGLGVGRQPCSFCDHLSW